MRANEVAIQIEPAIASLHGGPQMPWIVREVVANGRTYRAKYYITGPQTGDVLTAEDEAIVARVEYLESEITRLKCELAEAQSASQSVPMLSDAGTKPHNSTYDNESCVPSDLGPVLEPEHTEATMSNTGTSVVPTDAEPQAVATTAEGEQTKTATDERPQESSGSKSEAQLAAEVALVESPTLSNGVIGLRCGLSAERVRQIRKSMIESGQLQPVETVIGRDGQTQAASKGTGSNPE